MEVKLPAQGQETAQQASIRESRVIAIEETPIKGGRSGHGKMKADYFSAETENRDAIGGRHPFALARKAGCSRRAHAQSNIPTIP